MGFVIRTQFLGILFTYFPLFIQGQVLSLGLEYHQVLMTGNRVAPNDTALYLAGFENDPRSTFVGMMEWPIKEKASVQVGMSASVFQITTLISATTSISPFPTGAIYRYKYFDFGVPILLKLKIKKNIRIIAGIHPHLLIGRNQQNPERLYPEEHIKSLTVLGDAIKDNLKRTYVLGRYGIEVGLFKDRYSFYVVVERSLTNLLRNQKQAIATPNSMNYRGIGMGLQYRFRGKLE